MPECVPHFVQIVPGILLYLVLVWRAGSSQFWKFPCNLFFQETKKLIGWNFIGYTYFFSIKQHQRKGSNFRLTAVIHKITLKITHPRQTMLAGSEWFLPLYHCQVDIHLELISQIPLVVAVVVLVLWLLVAQSRRMTLWHLLFLFFSFAHISFRRRRRQCRAVPDEPCWD